MKKQEALNRSPEGERSTEKKCVTIWCRSGVQAQLYRERADRLLGMLFFFLQWFLRYSGRSSYDSLGKRESQEVTHSYSLAVEIYLKTICLLLYSRYQ